MGLFIDSAQTVGGFMIAMFLEGAPFLVLGSLLSSFIHYYVPEKFFIRLAGTRPFWGLLIGIFGGLILPTCECGSVPIVRRLIKKGLPPYSAIAYMLAAPVINPIVIAATLVAFRGNVLLLALRIGIVAVTAAYLGWILSRTGQEILRNGAEEKKDGDGTCCSEGCDEHHHDSHDRHRLFSALGHTAKEFMEMGTFFLLGALAASLFKTFFPTSAAGFLGNNPFLSVLVMMGFAVLLSVCSEADAFVATSFATFSQAAQLAFITIGPMVDIKLILMYRTTFTKKVFWLLIVVPVLFVFTLTLFLQIFLR